MAVWPFRKLTSDRVVDRAIAPYRDRASVGALPVLDDETPEMLQDLRGHGLSIDHLTSTDAAQFPQLSGCVLRLTLT